jgi:hypothetical protein
MLLRPARHHQHTRDNLLGSVLGDAPPDTRPDLQTARLPHGVAAVEVASMLDSDG